MSLFFALASYAGDDLTSALKALDSGNKAEAEAILKKMQRAAADAPETLLLDALLNENAEEAKAVYEFIYEEYPDFKYADLCLFRLYSYNYAVGNYITAEKYLQILKKKFPNSPYARAEDVLPEPPENVDEKHAGRNEKSKYAIQVGAFSNVQNAKALAAKFQERGYSAEISSKIVGSAIFNVVTVGEFASREEAEKSAKKIAENFNLKPRVIKSAR